VKNKKAVLSVTFYLLTFYLFFETTMNAVTIREMSPEDVPVIAEMEKASYTMPWSETSFLSEIYSQHSITRVAELNGNIVGYVCI